MDLDAEMEERIRQMKVRRTAYIQYVRNIFRCQPEVYTSFVNIMDEHHQRRIDIPDTLMMVSELFGAHPELVDGFCHCLPSPECIKDEVEAESMETLTPAKTANIEDGSAKPISEFAPTSSATASCSSNYSHATHSSYVSSGSSHASPENAAEPHQAPKEKLRLRDRTAYATYTKCKIMKRPEAYQHFIRLVKEIYLKGVNIHDVMERASNVLQEYPELLGGFYKYLFTYWRTKK